MVQPGDYEFPVNLLASFLSILSLNRCMRFLSSLEPNSNDCLPRVMANGISSSTSLFIRLIL